MARRIALLLSVAVAGTQHARNDPLAGHHPNVHMPGGIRVASAGTKVPPDRYAGRDRVERSVGQWRTSPVAPRPAGGDQPATTMSRPSDEPRIAGRAERVVADGLGAQVNLMHHTGLLHQPKRVSLDGGVTYSVRY